MTVTHIMPGDRARGDNGQRDQCDNCGDQLDPATAVGDFCAGCWCAGWPDRDAVAPVIPLAAARRRRRKARREARRKTP